MTRPTLAAAACTLLLAACTAGQAAPQSESAQNTQLGLKRQWMLEQWPGFGREELQRLQAGIDLTSLPQAGGSMGCNRLMFSVETAAPQQREGRIRFGSVAATRMYCDDRMKLEADFSSRIGSFTRYRLKGHYLILQNDQGQSARFVAQDWD